MKYILDTHILLWWLSDDPKLKTPTRNVIADSHNTIFVSAVTTWEIEIKKNLGKLKMPKSLDRAIEQSDFTELPIKISHTMRLQDLQDHQ